MEKFEIKNRYGLKIVGELHIPENPIGLAFIEHGLGGFKEQVSIVATVDTLVKNNYIVISFDATNSVGESDGKYEDATTQLHYEDLIDVINWTKGESWYKEPFILVGSSLGGYSVVRYSEENPKLVKGVFAKAPMVSGKFSFESNKKYNSADFNSWKETGWIIRKSVSKPDIVKRLPWSHMEERLNHDLRTNVSKLIMPVVLIVGENDTSCPVSDQQALYDLIPKETYKELHIIKDAPHTFKEEKDLNQLRSILDKWLKKLK
jgi:pimeloyl-ACP methyl ester carboxylesterase